MYDAMHDMMYDDAMYDAMHDDAMYDVLALFFQKTHMMVLPGWTRCLNSYQCRVSNESDRQLL